MGMTADLLRSGAQKASPGAGASAVSRDNKVAFYGFCMFDDNGSHMPHQNIGTLQVEPFQLNCFSGLTLEFLKYVILALFLVLYLTNVTGETRQVFFDGDATA